MTRSINYSVAIKIGWKEKAYEVYRSGSSRCINRDHVVSFHQSSIASISSQTVSSFTLNISYLALPARFPSRLATSIAALFCPLFGREKYTQIRACSFTTPVTHLRRSKSSLRSGKKSRGSSTANTASAVRNRKESPSSRITSHSLAHASTDI